MERYLLRGVEGLSDGETGQGRTTVFEMSNPNQSFDLLKCP